MPEARQEKNYFDFSKGLNTVSNEIGFPDGYSTDERNLVIERDGSRTRRKGLQEEASGVAKGIGIVTLAYEQCFKWHGAGGDPSKNIMVYQHGQELYFADDDGSISDSYLSDTVDMLTPSRLVDSTTTANEFTPEPCSFAVHRGDLIVTHKYLKPMVVKVNPATDAITVETINLLVRDFEGIDDGVAVDYQPGTLSDDHRYNLLNRGWKQEDIDDYATNSSGNDYPAKNMIWYKGYKRTDATAGVNPEDGDRAWDTGKMEAEAFGYSSSPQGSLFLNPLDTTYGILGEAGGASSVAMIFAAGNFAANPTSATTVTVTATGHGQSAAGSSFTCSGQYWTYNASGGGQDVWEGLNRTWTPTATAGTAPTAAGEVQVSDANTLVFYVTAITDWSSWQDTALDGQVDGTEAIDNSDGSTLTVGPVACESWAGRIWYAGIPDSEWADTIFFSRVVTKSRNYGKCIQAADPTDEFNNQLRDDDGGTVIIPDMGEVIQLQAVRNGMLVLTTNGVWEISGGGNRPFTATRISARMITDADCRSPVSVKTIEDSVVYAGRRGIIILSPNQYTGLLEDQLLSDVIEPTWTALPDNNLSRVQCVYDEEEKLIYFGYNEDSTGYDLLEDWLVFNMRTGGWYALEFNNDNAWGVKAAYSSNARGAAKIKFIVRISNSGIEIHDLDSTDYLDWDGAESPLPYIMSGWEGLGDFQRRKQAPVITVYNKNTGTGWTSTGNGWSEDNEGSVLMSGYWDWTDNSVFNKITDTIQTYRRIRPFVPTTSNSVDGTPVLVTRNKLRGRGRVLQLRFEGEAGKDVHLLGFTSNYKIKRVP
jgi:hypothetical protein